MEKLALQPIRPVRPVTHDDNGYVVRDPEHETHLVSIAALGVGQAGLDEAGNATLFAGPAAFDDFAKRRAHPGGVDLTNGRNLPGEALEELADCRNYLVWHIQQHLDGALAGESEAGYEYGRAMRALGAVVTAFVELNR